MNADMATYSNRWPNSHIAITIHLFILPFMCRIGMEGSLVRDAQAVLEALASGR